MRRVTITPVGVQNEIVIYDETADVPDFCRNGFAPRATRVVQQTDLARADFPAAYDRGNQVIEWEPVVAHTFDTVEDCQDFAGGRAALPGSGALHLHTEADGESFDRYYASAFLQEVELVEDLGLSVVFRYRIVFNSAYSEHP